MHDCTVGLNIIYTVKKLEYRCIIIVSRGAMHSAMSSYMVAGSHPALVIA